MENGTPAAHTGTDRPLPDRPLHRHTRSVRADRQKKLARRRLRYEKAAENGDPFAQYFLGLMYLTGKGALKNPEKAFDWFLQAARRNVPEAQYWLADCYAHGRGTAKSDREAMRWYRIAAGNGHIEAQTVTGLALLYGVGLQKNEKEAAVWLEKAANAGNARAQYYLYKQYRNGTGLPANSDTAMQWLERSARGGWPDAKKQLGLIHLDRYLRKKDNLPQATEAITWLKDIAQKDPKTMHLLGTLYQDGLIVRADPEEATRWYRRAAEAGDANGQNDYGQMLFSGKGVAQNRKEAARWFDKAARQGHAEARLRLAVQLLAGDGIAADPEKAVSLLQQAALTGNPKAETLLGAAYAGGTGVEQNTAKALFWLEKAAAHGEQTPSTNCPGSIRTGNSFPKTSPCPAMAGKGGGKRPARRPIPALAWHTGRVQVQTETTAKPANGSQKPPNKTLRPRNTHTATASCTLPTTRRTGKKPSTGSPWRPGKIMPPHSSGWPYFMPETATENTAHRH